MSAQRLGRSRLYDDFTAPGRVEMKTVIAVSSVATLHTVICVQQPADYIIFGLYEEHRTGPLSEHSGLTSLKLRSNLCSAEQAAFPCRVQTASIIMPQSAGWDAW